MENIEAYLQHNAIEEKPDSEELQVPIAPNSDPDIKAIVIAVLRRDKSLRKQRVRGDALPLYFSASFIAPASSISTFPFSKASN